MYIIYSAAGGGDFASSLLALTLHILYYSGSWK
jgi:hypothetical protein